MSKFIISGFYDEASSSLEDQLKLIKELGEVYLCPRSIDGKNISTFTLETFKEKAIPFLNQYGIKISTIGSPYGKIVVDDLPAFEFQLKQMANTVEICKEIGCKYIRIFSFFMPKGCEDYSDYHTLVIEKLKRMLELVKGTDIILLHENEKHIYGDEPNRCVKLCKDINDPQFKLIYDPSNYIQCGYDPLEAYELTKEYTLEYHIKDCLDTTKVEVPLGLGKANYDKILKDLVKRNFEGFVTLEPHTLKYALTKKALYILPFMSIFLKGWKETFKYIDDKMGIGAMKKATRKDVFVWQYNNLKKMIEKASK